MQIRSSLKGKEGELAVLFSLVIVLVLSFFCSLVEAARTQGARLQLEVAVDVACESLFASYDKKLYEEYDVFFFDGAFGEKGIQEDVLLKQLEGYIDGNLHPKSSYLYQNTDFYQLSIEDNQLMQITLASDDEGMVFREEAIRFMKMKYGIELVQQLLKQSELLQIALENGKEYEKEQRDNEQELKSLEEEKLEADKQNPDLAEAAKRNENPALIIKEQKAAGILDLIIEDSKVISQNGIKESLLPSFRELNEGQGYTQYDTTVLGRTLFNEYLMQKFNCALEEECDGNLLWYELEYLLEGKFHDTDNLKAVAGKLLLAREGINFAYLLTDTVKVAQAEAMAVTLVGYTGIPLLVEGTKYALLLAWAYGESLLDVRRLLAGKKVAIIKTAENWQLALSKVASVADCELKDDSGGLGYRDYLRLFLYLEKDEVLAKRSLDLVELHIRSNEQCAEFRVDHMVSSYEVLVTADSSSVFYNPLFFYKEQNWDGKVTYTIRRQFSYGMFK